MPFYGSLRRPLRRTGLLTRGQKDGIYHFVRSINYNNYIYYNKLFSFEGQPTSAVAARDLTTGTQC